MNNQNENGPETDLINLQVLRQSLKDLPFCLQTPVYLFARFLNFLVVTYAKFWVDFLDIANGFDLGWVTKPPRWLRDLENARKCHLCVVLLFWAYHSPWDQFNIFREMKVFLDYRFFILLLSMSFPRSPAFLYYRIMRNYYYKRSQNIALERHLRLCHERNLDPADHIYDPVFFYKSHFQKINEELYWRQIYPGEPFPASYDDYPPDFQGFLAFPPDPPAA